MSALHDPGDVIDITPGSHVCWIVGDPATYVAQAAAVLEQATHFGEKAVGFGPEGSEALHALAPLATAAVDPRAAFLDGGPLDPDAMFEMFAVQTARARQEGYRGLRVVADMDWLLPAEPATESIVAFELLLDRHAARLGVTIVCAYRTASFEPGTLTGASCVHPIRIGGDRLAPFRLVTGTPESWRLVGEVDVADAEHFHTAMATAVGSGTAVIDASDLDFIDLAGLRRVAEIGQIADVPVQIIGARPIVQRSWRLAGYAEIAPAVEFVG